MFIYIDETGNTGKNMFDEDQRYFGTMAVMCKDDFDARFSKQFQDISLDLNLDSIHVRKLKKARDMDRLCKSALSLIEGQDIRFTYTWVEKELHACAKLFDILFQTSNRAVPEMWYINPEIRTLLMSDFCRLVDEATVVLFWKECLNGRKEQRARVAFLKTLSQLRNHFSDVQDKRLKEVLTDAVSWAWDHPDRIPYFNPRTVDRRIHTPNAVYLFVLMKSAEEQMEQWRDDHCTIVHDRQHEYEEAIRKQHEGMTMADQPVREYLGYGQWVQNTVLPCSNLTFSPSETSAGLQFCDLCLSLLGRYQMDKDLSYNEQELLGFVDRNIAAQYHFTWEQTLNSRQLAVSRQYNLSPDQLAEGERIVALQEEERKRLMKEG